MLTIPSPHPSLPIQQGIGLSLDDALRFWQTEFTKGMSAEDFMKKYAYNIRHNYGKEGSRKDYKPYSCTQIILGDPPGANQFHGRPITSTQCGTHLAVLMTLHITTNAHTHTGCPYRHWDETQLRGALSKMQVRELLPSPPLSSCSCPSL